MSELHKYVIVLIDDDVNFSLSAIGCIQFSSGWLQTENNICYDRVLKEGTFSDITVRRVICRLCHSMTYKISV